jgi:hypothetical protein
MGAEGIYQRVGERAKPSLQMRFHLVLDRERSGVAGELLSDKQDRDWSASSGIAQCSVGAVLVRRFHETGQLRGIHSDSIALYPGL